MKLFHLFLAVGLAASYTIDSVLDSTASVTQADCRFQTTQDLAFVCRRCEATSAYQLGTETSFSVQGMLRSVRDKVEEILQDFQRLLPQANITFATVNDRFCFYLDGFESEPKYLTTIAGFTSFTPAELVILENFPATDVVTTYIGLEARQGSGSGHYYRYLETSFSAPIARKASPTLTLHLDSFTVKFDYSGAFVTYTGAAIFEGAATQVPFSVVVPYNRKASEAYTMHLAVRSQYRLGHFVDVLAPSYTCSSTLKLPGIPDVRLLPVLLADIAFYWDEKGEMMNFRDVVAFFYIPPFAIAPAVYLDAPTGSLRVRGDSQDCVVAVDSTWKREDVPTLSFHIDQRLDSPLTAYASLSNEPRTMTIAAIARHFYTELYPDPFNLYPLYSHSKANVGDTLSLIQVLEPRFRIVFDPEAVITITGTATYLTDEDAKVSIAIGRVDGALESFVQVEVTSAEILSRLVSAGTTPLTGFKLDVNTVVSSSVALGLSETSTMRPEGIEVMTTFPGFSSTIQMSISDQCIRSEFCTLLHSSMESTSLILTGRFIPDFFLLGSSLPNITLSDSLLIYNSVMRIYFGEPVVETWVEGLMDIQGDSHSSLNFRTNITNTNGDARLSAVLRGQWKQAFDLPTLTLEGLLLTADLNGKGEIVDSTIRGIATFGDCTTSDCWFGDATVSLSLLDYQESYVVIVMRPAEPQVIFTRLFNKVTVTPLLSKARFTSDITISYAYRTQDRVPAGLAITTQIDFLSLPSLLTTTSEDSSDTDVQLYLQMPFFSLGSGNIHVTGSFNAAISCRLDFSRETGATTGLIVGTVNLWGMSQVTDIDMTDSGMSMTLSGYPFGGVYYMDLLITGQLSDDITTSALSVSGDIDKDAIASLQTAVEQNLQRWTQQATDTLTRVKDFLMRQEDLIATYEGQMCATECPVVRECVGEPEYRCMQNPVLETCVGKKEGCSNVVVSCDSTATTCLQTEATCSVYDTQVVGGSCIEWVTTCINSIETCQNWVQSCTETVEQGCGLIQDTIVTDTCLRQELMCEERSLQDATCTLRCKNVEKLRDEAQTTYDVYKKALDDSIVAFGVLTDLAQPGTTVFRIESISFTRAFDEGGLGPNDIQMKVMFMIPSLVTQKMMAYTVQTKWNFFTEVENQVRLSQLVREQIVSTGQGRVSSSTVTESPEELFQELLRQAWAQH